MNRDGELERRYRALLTWYPVSHREAYAEEMIGVLLAAAPADRRRPSLADSLDLIIGAARVRLRTVLRSAPDPGWRDALAITSLLAPLLLVAQLPGQDLGWMAGLLWHSWNGTSGPLDPAWPIAVLLAPLAVGLLRLRLVAAVATAGLTAWIVVQAAFRHALTEPRLAGYLVLLMVEVAALTLSPGPRRGLRQVSGKAVLLALPWLAAAAFAGGLVPTHYPVPLVIAEIAIGVVVLAGLPALASARARRVLVLLVAIPGSAFAVSLLSFASVDFYSMSFAASQFALYLAPAALAGLTAASVRGSKLPPADPSPAAGAMTRPDLS